MYAYTPGRHWYFNNSYFNFLFCHTIIVNILRVHWPWCTHNHIRSYFTQNEICYQMVGVFTSCRRCRCCCWRCIFQSVFSCLCFRFPSEVHFGVHFCEKLNIFNELINVENDGLEPVRLIFNVLMKWRCRIAEHAEWSATFWVHFLSAIMNHLELPFAIDVF